MHPYSKASPRAFWSRSVSSNFDAESLLKPSSPLIRTHELVASAGSCFASNLVPYLEKSGFTYLRTETQHPAFARTPAENLGYDKFSAAYGNIYTIRQLLQLLRRSLGRFRPVEDRWTSAKGIIDPFRPGLRYHALSLKEFDLLTAQHLNAVRKVFEQTDVLIFTLGLTEAWVSRQDGAIFPACPGTVAGSFDSKLHAFKNFTVSETVQDIDAFVQELHEINPRARIILSVSPVPLVATATENHVLCASSYSKSVLRVAAEMAAIQHQHVTYFPAYEIVTGPQAPHDFFEADRRNVGQEAIQTVMSTFLALCQSSQPGRILESGRNAADQETPVETLVNASAGQEQILAQQVAAAECEEAMADATYTTPSATQDPTGPS